MKEECEVCGIAGVIYKKPNSVGKVLCSMLGGIQHRGPDSTGVALWGNKEDCLKIWFHYSGNIGQNEVVEAIKEIMNSFSVSIHAVLWKGEFLSIRVSMYESVDILCNKLEEVDGLHIISVGSSLEIFKDEGFAESIEEKFDLSGFVGTHGIGHTRLATESNVDIRRAHPFWANGFSDVAIVHNGQLTNYYTLKRKLERRGYRFRTDNDSELIAVYIADRLLFGDSLNQALVRSVEDFDGTFSYLVATLNEVGFAKDKLGAKPMAVLEGKDFIAIASEEVAIRRIFSDKEKGNRYWEPAPKEVMTWLR